MELAKDEERYGDGGSFQDEYTLNKAVGARGYAVKGRKRLTETGKARFAAKMEARSASAAGGEGEGEEEEAYSGDEEW